jgi:precorrin-8X/cobalt-precorrin-8 methylmutase
LDYLKDPDAIYRASFFAIRDSVDLSGVPAALQPVAVRLVHACGMPEIVAKLVCSGDPVTAARAALERGAPVFVDATMVAAGIMKTRLPGDNEIICTLNDDQAHAGASRAGTTRSAAAVDLWLPRLAGSVVAIGNAPTALFRLLELMAEHVEQRPAALFAFPVGFIGAAEAKEALIEADLGIPFMTLTGRIGGSAFAAAAINAVCLGADQ